MTAVDKVGKACLGIFLDNGQELRLMRGCVEAELLAATSSEGTMFRRNSFNSVCLAAYSRIVGLNYVKALLDPTISRLTKGNEDYEVDPSRSSSGSVPAKNLANLSARVEDIVNLMIASVHDLPKEIGYICCLLDRVVKKHFPDSGHTAIGGFIMLRLICPCLASPENAGLPVIPFRFLYLLHLHFIFREFLLKKGERQFF